MRREACGTEDRIDKRKDKTCGEFRFEDFEIWQEACAIGDELDEIAHDLEKQGKRRYAEQLRGALLSVSNNIAEGSGSGSDKDFRNFLNIARRSAYENANIILFLARRGGVTEAKRDDLIERLRMLSAKISGFSKSLD
jgi:four helix bundle protein